MYHITTGTIHAGILRTATTYSRLSFFFICFAMLVVFSALLPPEELPGVVIIIT